MTKRFLSFLLIVALLVCTMSACKSDKSAEDIADIITDAENHLDSTNHTVNIRMTFTSDDEDMKGALGALDSSEITLMSSGDNTAITLEMSFGDDYVDTAYVVIGDILYNTTDACVGDNELNLKQKSRLTAAERASVVRDAGAGAILSYEDFDALALESSDTVHLITCNGIKDESASSLIDMFNSSFGEATDAVSVTDAELIIRIVDGQYNGIYLNCSYSVTVNGITYDVRMQAVREYDFTTPVSIEAPSDADSYTLVPYNEIIK